METNNVLTRVQPETKEAYEAPVVEIVEVNVEQGFKDSDRSDSLGDDSRKRSTW